MDFKFLLLLFAVSLDRVQCQDRRCVSICNEEDEISNSGRNFHTGSSGRRGEKGDRGIPGKAGPFGLQGVPGEKGSQGVQGLPGIDGTAGVQGLQGEKGNQGVNGSRGIDGVAGIQGIPGGKGNQGVHGSPGIDGAAGIQGPPGTKGNQGVKGESGSTDGIAAFQQEIRNLMTDFNHSLSLLESKLNAAKEEIDGRLALSTPPKNCSLSNEDRRQLLSSGENVYCHKHWRVIQRRFNGQVIFHNKTWNEYKNGFGSLSTEFWIGLDNIHNLTRNGGCKLRVELGAFDGSEAYAEYREFSIGSESDLFRLHISGYSGNAGDSIMVGGSENNNNMAFSTIDRDNDRSLGNNCAAYREGGRGAWWFNNCGYARLNGRWEETINSCYSMRWHAWKHNCDSLKLSMMMIRCD